MVAGLLAVAAAPALAAPVTVDRAVEGADARRSSKAAVTTDVRPFSHRRRAARLRRRRRPAARSIARRAGRPSAADLERRVRQPDVQDRRGRERQLDPATSATSPSTTTAWRSDVGSCDVRSQDGDEVLFAYARVRRRRCSTLTRRRRPAKPGETVTLDRSPTRDDRRRRARPVGGARVTGADGTRDRRRRASARRLHDLKADAAATKAGALATASRVARHRAPRRCAAGRSPSVAAPDRAAAAAALRPARQADLQPRAARAARPLRADASGHQDRQAAADQAPRQASAGTSLGGWRRFRSTKCGTRRVLRDRRSRRLVVPAARSGWRTGRYVLDAIAIDGAGNRTPLARGDARGWCSPSDEARSPSSRPRCSLVGLRLRRRRGVRRLGHRDRVAGLRRDAGRADRRRQTAREGETVMRLLQRSFDVKTRFGGNFVQEIDGHLRRARGRPAGRLVLLRQRDRGLRGRGRARLYPGDRVWWDHHDWEERDARPGRRRRVPGAVPVRAPTARSCRSGSSASGPRAARATRSRRGCSDAGVRNIARSNLESSPGEVLRILVGRWSRRAQGHRGAPARGGPGGLGRLRQAGRRRATRSR